MRRKAKEKNVVEVEKIVDKQPKPNTKTNE
jgi:hypothetical protein